MTDNGKKLDAASELPLGLGMALAQDMAAMERFSRMGAAEQAALVEQARSAGTRMEMQALIDSISRGDMVSGNDYTGSMPFMAPEDHNYS